MGRSKAELNEDEREALWHLRRHVVNEPKPARETMDNAFLAIWNAAFPNDRRDRFQVGEEWKRLGFQGCDPATDVRTGAFPLQQLERLALQRPELLKEKSDEALEGKP